MVQWMGRYRPLVAELVKHTHEASRALYKKFDMGDGVCINSMEWQVLEYVYEHGEDEKMAHIYERIGLAQSSFSKCVKTLESYDLIEKYHTSKNRKNVIIKITDKGRDLYEKGSVGLAEGTWGAFFETLDGFSDEEIETLVRAMVLLNKGMPGEEDPPELVRIP